MKLDCCSDFKGFVDKGDLVIEYGDTCCISGRPNFEYDNGENEFYNNTSEYLIKFCPFCGANLYSGYSLITAWYNKQSEIVEVYEEKISPEKRKELIDNGMKWMFDISSFSGKDFIEKDVTGDDDFLELYLECKKRPYLTIEVKLIKHHELE